MRQSDGNRALYKLPMTEVSSEAIEGLPGGACSPSARVRSPLLLKTTSFATSTGSPHQGPRSAGSKSPAGNVGTVYNGSHSNRMPYHHVPQGFTHL